MSPNEDPASSEAQSTFAEFDGWPHASWKRIASLKWEGLRFDDSSIWLPRNGEFPLDVWWDSSPRRIARSVSSLLIEMGFGSGRSLTLTARRTFYRRQLPSVSVQLEIVGSDSLRVSLPNFSTDPTGELNRNSGGRRSLSLLKNMAFEQRPGLEGQHSVSLSFANHREFQRTMNRTFSLLSRALLPTGPIYCLDTKSEPK